MRTTLDIDDALIREAKKVAAKTGRTLTSVIEDALRETLIHKASVRSTYKLRWPTVRGRVLPGIDITDRDSLYERMEGRS